jgi:hypothetical protein
VRSLASFVGLCDVPVEKIKQAASDQLGRTLFAAFAPSMHMRDGKVTFRARDPESKLREAIARNVDVMVSGVEQLLARALSRLSGRVTPSTMLETLIGCPWIQEQRLHWFKRASERFHAGDFMSSGLIVAMQYEGVVRDLARAAGLSALKSDSDGILMDETLWGLVSRICG